jgi:hypothetical protein
MDFLDGEGARTRIMQFFDNQTFVPEVPLMRSAILGLKTFLLRGLPGFPYHQLGLGCEDWFDIVRPTVIRFLEWKLKLDEQSLMVGDELVCELFKTASVLWALVGFRSPEEISGQLHWAVAEREPGLMLKYVQAEDGHDKGEGVHQLFDSSSNRASWRRHEARLMLYRYGINASRQTEEGNLLVSRVESDLTTGRTKLPAISERIPEPIFKEGEIHAAAYKRKVTTGEFQSSTPSIDCPDYDLPLGMIDDPGIISIGGKMYRATYVDYSGAESGQRGPEISYPSPIMLSPGSPLLALWHFISTMFRNY